MTNEDLHKIRNKMQGAQNLICFAQEYFSPDATEKQKEIVLPFILKSIPHANSSMEFLRTFIPSSNFTNASVEELFANPDFDILKKE